MYRYFINSKVISLLLLFITVIDIVTGRENSLFISGKIYLISIGVSGDNKDNKITDLVSCQYCPTCTNDAIGFRDFIIKSCQKKDSQLITNNIISYVYNKDISIDTLYTVFKLIKEKITSEDYFIFYYSSATWTLINDNVYNEKEALYSINSTFCESVSKYKLGFTLRQLKSFTDGLATKNQLIIFDSGSGKVIRKDFYRNFFSSNPLEAEFTQKNRIILCPELYSSEAYDENVRINKGDLFYCLSNLPDSLNIIELFNKISESRYKYLMEQIWKKQIKLRATINILKEVDFIEILLSLYKIDKNNNRGVIVSSNQNQNDSLLFSKKKYALIIATEEYEANSWPKLLNPITDGKSVGKVLSDLYGYEVRFLFNSKRDSILDAINELSNKGTNPYNQFIVYFAGHGFYDPRQKSGYIVCKDSKEILDFENPRLTELNSYVDYNVLFRKLDNELNRVLIITDVCFGGLSINSFQYNGIKTNPENETTKLRNPFKKVLASGITSVDDYYQNLDHDISINSPFASALLRILRNNNKSLSLQEVMGDLKKENLSPTPVEFNFGETWLPGEFMF